ncbi:ATP-dependent DNA ligase [Kineosporia sp. R_H_3]|uniref:ATP-dependent DNA ligase n=1 Tax=Kineosporia sp. R_H_3 TaxID=1961848 RepID=UPI000B4AE027|nr:ATP-dependent DNA ligase [Kineosporia sp. R_H_3]
MLLADVAAASEAVAAVSGKKAKVELLAGALRAATAAEVPSVAAWLSGQTRQRRLGVGWAAVSALLDGGPPEPATATLTVEGVERAFEALQDAGGAGSQAARATLLRDLVLAATGPERRLLAGLVTGELRQGAQAGLLLDAIALAAAVPAAAVRRAVTLTGDPAAVAVAALDGGEPALAAFGLRVGTALSPMLAASAPSLTEAFAKTGPAGVEWKLDGVRVQVHRDGDDVAVFTRTLDDVTARLPGLVAEARTWPAGRFVVDGEVLALRPDGRPEPFQVTSSLVARHTRADTERPLTTVLFDALHVDGTDLLDADGPTRRAALATVAPAGLLVPRHVVEDAADPGEAAAAEAFAADALARGHEGVVVKALAGAYAMGRRGAGWVKVKPRITLDLVVLAAEWGHGRRTGLLSNLHLGARDPDGRFGPPGGFVMLGKTFKGLTDAMLAWQTEHLRGIERSSNGWRVDVEPTLVVEIAFDGVQTSSRYPAGVALRFARVIAHRPDKPAAEADTVDTVLSYRPV